MPPPDQSPLVAQRNAPQSLDDETDNDTTGKPPLAAFEGPGVGARDGFGPVAGPEAYGRRRPRPCRRVATASAS